MFKVFKTPEFKKAIAEEDKALKKLGRDPMNILQRNSIKKFDNNDPSTYPSNPEQRRKLMAQQKLEVLKKAAPKKEEAPKAEVKEASADYSSMTVAELKAVAKEKGITGYTSLKKAELIEALSK